MNFCVLFHMKTRIFLKYFVRAYSYVDDNTPYVSDDNIDGVIKSLEEVSEFYLNRSMITS